MPAALGPPPPAARLDAAGRFWALRHALTASPQPARRWTCLLHCRAATAEPQAGAAGSLQLAHPSGRDVHVFGVEHLKADDRAAQFILDTRPSAVVVETALNAAHGEATGSVVRADSRADDFFVGIFQQLGRQLSWEASPTTSDFWQGLRPHWAGEQLAYIAAFAVEADIVYGDEAKHDTFRRLVVTASLTDLDAAFAEQCWLNFQELLGEPAGCPPLEQRGAVDAIMLTQREAVMCRSLAAAADAGTAGVVGVVGADHLPGIQQLWQADAWRPLCEAGSKAAAGAGKLGPAVPAGSSAAGLTGHELAGVRRALLESVLRLKSVPAVVDDMRRALGELPPEAWEPYCWAHELYAAPRMLLAALTREQLQRVCGGRGCEMWEVLAPLRAARPANGGSGLDVDLVMDLRALNYEFA